jgi:hypothetical protein
MRIRMLFWQEDTMRVVNVVANSHISALRQAVRDFPNAVPQVHYKWYPIISRRIRDGQALPAYVKKVDLKADLTLIHGHELFIRPPLEFYSASVMFQALIDSLTDSVAYRIATLLRSKTDMPMIIAPTPLPAREDSPSFYATDEYEKNIKLLDYYATQAINVRVIGQPLDTIVDGWHTDISLAHNGSSGDMKHMTGMFGLNYLKLMEKR